MNSSRHLAAASAYVLMIGGTVLGFLLIRSYGQGLSAPPPSETSLFGTARPGAPLDALAGVLLALAVVIITARLLGKLFGRFGQPPVIGEVIAGILLGPSLLGRIAPGVAAFLLPPTITPHMQMLSQVGVILFMLVVGIELDTGLLRRRGHAAVAISHASIVVPFLFGSLLALVLYPRLSSSDVPFTYFALFMGVSMSVTAFPVLARILIDGGLSRSRIGAIALACAAVDDVTAWCLLAFVVSVVQSGSGGLTTAAMTLGYVAGMLLLVRPLVLRLVRAGEENGVAQGTVAIVFVALLLSALATESIGIHALFGAFLLGVLIPHDSKLARAVVGKLQDVVVVLLLPAFFAVTGMRTQIGLVSGGEQWLLCLLIVLTACGGKFGGTLVAARAAGIGWREAAALGALMNTRGLMELIVLNVGLDLGVISPALFAMLVVMAVVTTLLTSPVLGRLAGRTARDRRSWAVPIGVLSAPTGNAPHVRAA